VFLDGIDKSKSILKGIYILDWHHGSRAASINAEKAHAACRREYSGLKTYFLIAKDAPLTFEVVLLAICAFPENTNAGFTNPVAAVHDMFWLPT
jgi:hypothetical protein